MPVTPPRPGWMDDLSNSHSSKKPAPRKPFTQRQRIWILIFTLLITTTAFVLGREVNQFVNLKQNQIFIHKYEARQTSSTQLDPQQLTLHRFLVSQARVACLHLDEGLSLQEAWNLGVADGMSSDQAATVIDLAVEVYCPRHLDLLTEEGKTT